MYAFPKLSLPAGAAAAAAAQGKQPDFLYCMELLDQTGIVTVPGSGFGQVRKGWLGRWAGTSIGDALPDSIPGAQCAALPCHRLLFQYTLIHPPTYPPLLLQTQEPGTYHVRTTILPPEADMAVVSQKIAEFHAGFMVKHKNGGA